MDTGATFLCKKKNTHQQFYNLIFNIFNILINKQPRKTKQNNIPFALCFIDLKNRCSKMLIVNQTKQNYWRWRTRWDANNIGGINFYSVVSITFYCYDTIHVHQLLGVTKNELMLALTNKTIKAHGEVIRSRLDVETSICAKDALAKAVYSRLFEWLVMHINETLKTSVCKNNGRANNKNKSIGILDIYGFEILQNNGWVPRTYIDFRTLNIQTPVSFVSNRQFYQYF